MLKLHVKTGEALQRLRADKNGVVTLEYVIVVAFVVTAVIAAFITGGSIPAALSIGFTAITTAMTL